MAIAPLVWLVALTLSGQHPSSGWWWIAGAFAVSAVADLLGHKMNPWIPSAVYPIVQSTLIASVIAPRRKAAAFALVLIVVSITDTILTRNTPPHGDWALRSVAWLGLVWLVWTLPVPRLRLALLEAFGVGWMAWIGLLLIPGPPDTVWGSPSWLTYQAVRATSLLLFCWASWKPPVLQVAR